MFTYGDEPSLFWGASPVKMGVNMAHRPRLRGRMDVPLRKRKNRKNIKIEFEAFEPLYLFIMKIVHIVHT